MIAFVLGATGFVGREVVRQLCVRGAKVVAHVRPDSPSLERWRERFAELGAAVDTTPWDTAAMTERIRELTPAQLYICIGTTKAAAKRDGITGNIYEQVDLRLTKIAVDAASAAATEPRVVFLSSVGADPAARAAYLKARGQAEQVVASSGLPYVIARPSLIVGERDEARIAERGAAVVADSVLAVVGVLGGKRLRDRYASTSNDVLASALIRLGEGSAIDRVFEGADLR
ncbi:MAG TPA: NAD(P)H-binding protein [Kofleriaceae bacterium]|nr:NAD(P)H-binding protein [Kofleriaceae bacterium]